MIILRSIARQWSRHKITLSGLVLCLFGLFLTQLSVAQRQKGKGKVIDNRIYLDHADELFYDEYVRPGVQVVKGNVSFRHKGAKLTCDSAYFRQEDNSFEAFGRVRLIQGDTLSMSSEYALYDGRDEMIRARRNVILRHRKSVLRTDSLDYDRKFSFGYFFEGGEIVDGKDRISSDWGEYNTQTREATFYYQVKLKSPKYTVHTDTLYYDTRKRIAHISGPSTIYSDGNIIQTTKAYYDSKQDRAQLFERSTIEGDNRTITADSLYNDSKTGRNEGFGNVVYIDRKNKNELHAGYCFYDEKKGVAIATKKALAVDYSQKDTLWVHADTIRMKTFNLDTDSMYRHVYAYYKVRAYRNDVQAVCDSLVINSKDSTMMMYKDPIVWQNSYQLLGEQIMMVMQDSTIRFAHVMGQASSVELMKDGEHYNQVASREMKAYFEKGKLRITEAIGNVQSIQYPLDDKDSTIIAMNYLEGDTMRMYFNQERKLQRIWVSKPDGTAHPLTQVPPDKHRLPNFAWFDYIRPLSKDDVFVWRGKGAEAQLKPQKRRESPIQKLGEPLL